MKIEERQIGDVTVLSSDRPLVNVDADQLKGYLVAACGNQNDRIVLDATGIAYVDSYGLETLVDVAEMVASRGWKLALVGANETLREVMELTAVSHLFTHFDEVDVAVASFCVQAQPAMQAINNV